MFSENITEAAVIKFASELYYPNHTNFKIVFIGDSLIDRGQVLFQMLDQIRYTLLQKHPLYTFELFNEGVGGNRIDHIRRRLDRSVFPKFPDAVVLYWDSDVSDVDENLITRSQLREVRRKYVSNVQSVLQQLLQRGMKVIMSGPTLLGERPHGQNYEDNKIDEYREINVNIARNLGVDYIDMRKAFFQALPHKLAEIVCGFPGIYRPWMGLTARIGAMTSCWLAEFFSGGWTRLVTNSDDNLRYREVNGYLTLDGEHHNKRGVAIAVQLFSAALDSWLSSRDPIGSVVIDSWEHFSGDLGFSTSRFPQPRDMIAALHDMRLRVLLSVSPVWSNQSLSYLQSTSLGGGDRVGVVGAKRGLWLTRRDVETKAVLDISDPAAVSWLTSRLSALRASTNVDGFILSAPTGEDERTLASITSSASSENLYYNSTAVLMAGGYTPLLSLVLQDVLRGAL